MNKILCKLLLILMFLVPSVSFAKPTPIFLQTGDELFEIEDAPKLWDGSSIGYACKRFGLFYADLWTWDCKIMVINIDEFSAGELDEEMRLEFSSMYSLSDRVRNPWNHYGGFVLALFIISIVVIKLRQ
ncbi:hypothetical protein QUF74_00145 [Candidatus Halobeggiatoa sp. HSG11]|nr:hypothetical protein [Candidatus Halobeggiatoa sp. HSG11]